ALARLPRARPVGWVGPAGSTSLRPQSPAPMSAEPWPAGSLGRAVFFSSIGGIGTGDPMFGPLPRHAQAAEGHTNGFVADQPRGETLGKTHLGGQRQCPPAGGLARRAWTFVEQRSQGLADPRGEHRRRGMWS